MDLDRWQKLTDISVKGILTIAISGGTLWYSVLRYDGDHTKLCTDSLDQTFHMVVNNRFSEPYKAMLEWRIKAHEKVCGKLSDKMVAMLNNAWLPPAIMIADGSKVDVLPTTATTDTHKSNGDNGSGISSSASYSGPTWVATSRKNDPAYSAVNFDLQAGDKNELNKPGNILVARWFVNLRAKNTPVSKGDNPVVGQLVGGDCVKVLEHVSGTINEWAKVEPAPCH